MPPESSASRDARITRWAIAHGKVGRPSDFASRLSGEQVAAQLLELFRDSPTFGRDVAERISPFLDESTNGTLGLVSAGGEAVIFGDDDRQTVIKLLAPPGTGKFGWVIERRSNGRLAVRGGSLAEALIRFAHFETQFPSGLELDQIGVKGEFLALRQPFIVGEHPDENTLHDWMHEQGWEPHMPATDQATLLYQTWIRDSFIATDVRPANALIAECDGEINGIDFIVALLDEL